MVKQLVIAATPLLIYDAPEAIQYTRTIFNITILAQYISHNNKTLRYMEYALYRLENIKIIFEYHRPIDFKLYRPTFNYLKFPAISHFVQCIWDYGSAVNYNTTHSKAAHKYFLKAFYNKTNKKEYDLQIWQYNVCHTNIIAMKDVIISEKAREEKMQSESIADMTALAKVAWVSSFVDLAERYNWAMSNADLDTAKKLGLTGIKKYWRHAGSVEMELD